MNAFINLMHLKFFCDAVTYKSISEAAKMNYISQSAVSQAIKKLESLFGAKLISYHRQKLHPTEEGNIVLEQASNIFKAVQLTFDKVQQVSNEFAGTLKFVTTKSLGMSLIAPNYQRLRSSLPFINFSFKMGGLNLIRTYLRREEAEFAIVVHDHNFHGFSAHPIKKGRLNLYKAESAPLDIINNGIFVDEYEGMYTRELLAALQGLPKPIHIQDALAGWELVARFTQIGIGVGFFPDYIVSNGRYPNLHPYPIELPPFEYEICVIYNKGTKLSKTAQAFIDHIH